MQIRVRTIVGLAGAIGAIHLCSVLCLALPGQSGVLKGVVLANESGGTPVAHVKISAIGANPTETGTDGVFILRFPNRQSGDVVQVQASKSGYAVVNFFQLKACLPRDPDAEQLNIFLSKEAE